MIKIKLISLLIKVNHNKIKVIFNTQDFDEFDQ